MSNSLQDCEECCANLNRIYFSVITNKNKILFVCEASFKKVKDSITIYCSEIF